MTELLISLPDTVYLQNIAIIVTHLCKIVKFMIQIRNTLVYYSHNNHYNILIVIVIELCLHGLFLDDNIIVTINFLIFIYILVWKFIFFRLYLYLLTSFVSFSVFIFIFVTIFVPMSVFILAALITILLIHVHVI